MRCALRTENRQHFSYRHFPDSRQTIRNLYLFVTQLLFIRQMLPFAASAYAEMFAKRNYPFLAVLMECDSISLCIMTSFTGQTDIYYIPRCRPWHKNNHFIHFGNCFAFGCNIRDLYLFQYREGGLFSCQICE